MAAFPVDELLPHFTKMLEDEYKRMPAGERKRARADDAERDVDRWVETCAREGVDEALAHQQPLTLWQTRPWGHLAKVRRGAAELRAIVDRMPVRTRASKRVRVVNAAV